MTRSLALRAETRTAVSFLFERCETISSSSAAENSTSPTLPRRNGQLIYDDFVNTLELGVDGQKFLGP